MKKKSQHFGRRPSIYGPTIGMTFKLLGVLTVITVSMVLNLVLGLFIAVNKLGILICTALLQSAPGPSGESSQALHIYLSKSNALLNQIMMPAGCTAACPSTMLSTAAKVDLSCC